MNALDALGNPLRREILEKLSERPLSVGELAKSFTVSRPAISRHLKVLEDAGLAEHVADGRRNLYKVRVEGFASVQDYFESLWGDAIARYRLLADNLEEP